MTTEELLIVERGRWVSADCLFMEPDEAPARLIKTPKPLRQCQGPCRQKLEAWAFEGPTGRQQTVCATCRATVKERRDERKRAIADGMQRCESCGTDRPETSFFWIDYRFHDLGRRTTCVSCCRKAAYQSSLAAEKAS